MCVFVCVCVRVHRAPGQLQEELNRKSWYLSSADGATIIDEMLRKEPIPSVNDSFVLGHGGDGIDTWNKLMANIGRSEQVDDKLTFDDMMLRLWIRMRLSGRAQPEAHFLGNGYKFGEKLEVGALLVSTPFSTFTLAQQYMHKALILIVETSPSAQYSIGIILNRPLNNMANFVLPASSGETGERRVSFGGEIHFGGFNNADAVLLLHRRPELGGRRIGDSSLYQLKEDFTGSINDLILTRGFNVWEDQELQSAVDQGMFVRVAPSSVPWADLWELSGPTGGNAQSLDERISDIHDAERGEKTQVDGRISERLLQRGIGVWEKTFANFLSTLPCSSSCTSSVEGAPDIELPDGIAESNSLGDAALSKWMDITFNSSM